MYLLSPVISVTLPACHILLDRSNVLNRSVDLRPSWYLLQPVLSLITVTSAWHSHSAATCHTLFIRQCSLVYFSGLQRRNRNAISPTVQHWDLHICYKICSRYQLIWSWLETGVSGSCSVSIIRAVGMENGHGVTAGLLHFRLQLNFEATVLRRSRN